MTSRRLLLSSASALAALSWLLPQSVAADEPVPVVATFSILGDMVQRIGGEHIALSTLVGPNGDSHVYQPTPQDARAVSQAEIVFMNGLEFEGWMERLTEAAGFDGTLVVATAGIDAIAYDEHDDHDDHADHDDDHDHDHAEDKDDHNHDHAEHKDHDDHGEEHADHDDHDHDHDHAEHKDNDDHGEEHADHDDHDHDHDHAEHKDHDDHGEEHADHDDDDHGHDHAGHNHGAFDPHAWMSLASAVTYVDNITAALAKADPDNAGDFYTNRASYVTEIEALAEDVAAMMAAIPEARRNVVTSHDAFGYFGRDYDLTFLAPQGLSTDSEASASDVAELIEQIRDEGISAVFVETLTDNRLLQQIANETGATIGGTLYTGALSEEDGPAPTYLDMIRYNATTLSGALGS